VRNIKVLTVKIGFVLNMTLNAFPSKGVEGLVLSQHHLTNETLGRNKEDVVRIVSDFGGLHAQSFESPYLSLWNRMTNFDWEWLDHLLKQKKLIAAHLMRVTLHIVPAKEFPMYFQATRDAMRKFLTRRGLSWPPKFTKTHQAIMDFINEKGAATTLEIRRFLESKSLPSKNLHRIIHYELAGIGAILRSERRLRIPTQWKWSATERLIDKSSLEAITEEEAKGWLAQKYLKAFGPSSIEDVISYTGYTKTETKRIIERLVAKGRISTIRINNGRKHWILSEDVDKLKEFEAKDYPTEGFGSVHVLPEFDPLTVGYRKRWKELISVPPYRPGLRAHPAPGVILVDGQIFGRYLIWPNFTLFFNLKKKGLKVIKVILNKFEEMAALQGMQVFCVKKIDGKEVTSKELEPILRYFYESGYSIRKGGLCKELA
jgi:uncharacterized protein YcaQ